MQVFILIAASKLCNFLPDTSNPNATSWSRLLNTGIVNIGLTFVMLSRNDYSLSPKVFGLILDADPLNYKKKWALIFPFGLIILEQR